MEDSLSIREVASRILFDVSQRPRNWIGRKELEIVREAAQLPPYAFFASCEYRRRGNTGA